MQLRIATCLTLPERDPDRGPLDEALAEAGVDFAWLAWDDPAADWDAPVPTILRSTWNYALAPDAFLAWCERVARAAPLWNPPEVVRANLHKRYLLDLAARGVPTVPTALVERGATPHLARLAAARGWDRIVVKPAIGAGSLDARAFDARELDAAEEHARRIAGRVEVLVQPYLDSVHDHGERSLVWIDGEITHAIRKSPRFAGEDERVTGPHSIDDDERAVALASLGPWAERILYGRVDVARDAGGRPVVMELELVEPSLFFAKGPGSADRYVRGLLRRLGAPLGAPLTGR